MKRLTFIISTALTATIATGCANNSYSYGYDYSSKNSMSHIGKVNTQHGEVFTSKEGLTLYTFTKDRENESTCYDTCANNWPPLFAKEGAKEWGKFTVIERKDGTFQWAWNDKPLYTWVGDTKKGDTNGHGIGNVWYVANTH